MREKEVRVGYFFGYISSDYMCAEHKEYIHAFHHPLANSRNTTPYFPNISQLVNEWSFVVLFVCFGFTSFSLVRRNQNEIMLNEPSKAFRRWLRTWTSPPKTGKKPKAAERVSCFESESGSPESRGEGEGDSGRACWKIVQLGVFSLYRCPKIT